MGSGIELRHVLGAREGKGLLKEGTTQLRARGGKEGPPTLSAAGGRLAHDRAWWSHPGPWLLPEGVCWDDVSPFLQGVCMGGVDVCVLITLQLCAD